MRKPVHLIKMMDHKKNNSFFYRLHNSSSFKILFSTI